MEASSMTLGIRGDRFTVNGEPSFLLGISAMDAVGRLTDTELDWLRERGFNLLRVWGYWKQVLLDSQAPNLPPILSDNILFRPDGTLDPEKTAQLKDLLQRAGQRGMVVDLTVFNAFDSFSDDPHLIKHTAALEALTDALKGCGNVLFDLWNEHNNAGRIHPYPISHQQARMLKDRVKAIDRDRIVTVSNTHHAHYSRSSLLIDLWNDPDDTAVARRHGYPEARVKMFRERIKAVDGDRIVLEDSSSRQGIDYVERETEEKFWSNIRTELLEVEVDVLTPHLARTLDFDERTGERVRALTDCMRSIGRVVPVYLQEEARRRHSGLNPEKNQFIRAARNAKAAGAAAWTFHTDAAYILSLGPIYTQLDAVERSTADELATALQAV
ncbi:MAG: cellulase family glycosylhydrolase [Chloroflexi bacterium]|nr:cellulase family glycosylhydrolase [Chloroflexota bacterium]